MWNCMKKFFTSFCTESSVHGVKYLIQDKNKISRCYWCIVLIFALFCCGQFSILLSRRFLEIPIRMVIRNHQALTGKLRLPSITFCSESPTTNEWYEKFLDNVTLPPHIPREKALEAMQFGVSQVTPRYEPIPKEINTTLLEILDQLLEFNDIKPRDFMERISVPCDVLISRCRLRGSVVPCGEILRRVRGQCCLFDDDKPSHNPGKVFVNNLIVVTTMSYGDSYFIVHNIESEPIITQTNTMSNGYYIMFYTEPIQILKSEEVHEVEEESGVCVHPDEQYLKFFDVYDTSRCTTEYNINSSLAACDCVGTYIPAPDSYTCNFTQLACLKMRPDLKLVYGSENEIPSNIRLAAQRKGIELQAKCPKKCEYLSFKYNFKPRTLVTGYEYTGFFDGVEATNEYVVQFNYDSPFYTVQEFVLITDWITLLSNLGGVYGLFLGCSMVTLAEFIYYLWSTVISKLCDANRVDKHSNDTEKHVFN